MKTMLKKAQKGTSATVIAIVTHEWRLRLWLRSSSQNGDRDCDCDCKSCDYDCDCDCDSLSCLWLCANWTTDCDCDSSGDCDPVGTCVFCDYDYSDSAIGSSGVVTATSFFRALRTFSRGLWKKFQSKKMGFCQKMKLKVRLEYSDKPPFFG